MQKILHDRTFNNALRLTRTRRGNQTSTSDALEEQVTYI